MLSRSTFGVRFDHIFTDNITDLKKESNVIVVGIDDKTLKSLGTWPFHRDVYANLIDQLYKEGARLVVFDILFITPGTRDDTMRASLGKQVQHTVFASKLDSTLTYFPTVYSVDDNALSALANVYPDEDGKVRTEYLFNRDKNGNCIPTLSYMAFFEYTKEKSFGCDDASRIFVYPDTMPKTFSLVDVLGDKIAQKDIEGKVVFVGSVSLDLDDHFVSNHGDKIPGVYIHAAMFSQMVHGFSPVPIIFPVAIILALLGVLYTVVISFRKTKTVYQFEFLVIGLIVVLFLGLLFCALGAWFPFALVVFSYIASSIYTLMFRYGITEKRSKHIRGIFSKYVHSHVLDELLKQPEVRLGGEKRHMSILFSDLRGFTTLSESLDPQELTTLLNQYFSAMTPEILEEKGTIDKFIGDAIMAFWNAPLLVPDYCTCAVKSALRMIKALEIFNETHATSLAVGIGIHAGDVVVGNVGGADHVSYTVLGDAVNLASRVEGLTKKYGVGLIVTGDVRDRVTDKSILFRKLDVITVKGKSQATTLYEAMENTEENEARTLVYEQGFNLYFQGLFEESLMIFLPLVKSHDGPAVMMTERIRSHLLQKTIGKELLWDGVWHFDEK
jgi:adenylate cyclase